MRSAGFDAKTYTSGQVFWEKKDWHRPGCLVLDVRMPGLGGFELQERLIKAGCKMPVIFMSAHENTIPSRKVIGTRVLGFLQKPFEDHTLLELVHTALNENFKRRK